MCYRECLLDLGIHVIADLRQCDASLIDDLDYVKHSLHSAAETLAVTLIAESFHKFSPQGVTGILSIAESHISVHTWPETLFAAIDIFTCGTNFDPLKAAHFLSDKFECQSPEFTVLHRGAGLGISAPNISEVR